MPRVFNFSAGPSMLPLTVLEKAKSELLEYGGSGQSVMEMSHRSGEYLAIIEGCEAKLRTVLDISGDYSVLFLQGGAWTQFSMLPMNLMTVNGTADFVLSGNWAEKAYIEAKRFGKANVVASSEADYYSYIPEIDKAGLDETADYLHICCNNTIYGTEFRSIPECAAPLAADVSSTLLSRPLDVSQFGILYAGAQKNMGIAGLTVVIIKNCLLERSPDSLPPMFSYNVQRGAGSMFNTPPTFAVYMMSLMLDWLEREIGGLEAMEEINAKKAGILYDYLDESRLFRATARKDSRSRMNVCFVTKEKAMDSQFCAAAEKRGLLNLAGHRLVGGARASIYNAMPVEGVTALRDFMREFEKERV